MLVIRLTRTGKIHDPHYRLVVQEKRSKLNGKAIDIVGHYHPTQKENRLVIDGEKVNAWIAKGAQTSETVNNLLVKAGIFAPEKKISKHFEPKEKPASEAPAAAPAEEAASEEATDTPAKTAEEPAEEAPATEEETAPEAEEAPEEPAEETPAEEA